MCLSDIDSSHQDASIEVPYIPKSQLEKKSNLPLFLNSEQRANKTRENRSITLDYGLSDQYHDMRYEKLIQVLFIYDIRYIFIYEKSTRNS